MQSYKPKIKTVALTISIIVISSVWQGFCFSSPNKKIAFGDNSKRFSVVGKALYAFPHHKEAKPKDAALEHRALPFKIRDKSLYQVHFNGIKVGTIELEYQGREKIDKIWQDVIRLASNVKILKLFQIQSEEVVYMDKDTYLPLKVQRKVKFLGREESILEEYHQKEGWVKIIQAKGKVTEERLMRVNPPIHNVLILYFLYPLDLKDEAIGKTYEFNLPTRKISIKLKEARRISTHKAKEEFYILEGSPRRFKVWLKKTERLPLRVEIPAFLGRIVITRI